MQIVRAVNTAFKISKTNFVWMKKIEENKKNMEAQLKGVSKAISGIAKNLEEDIKKQIEYENEKKQITEKIAVYQASYDSAAVELEKEILGTKTGVTSGKIGFGTNAKRKTELKEQRKADLENYIKQVAPRQEYLDKEISKVYTNLETERNKTETFEDKFNGFAARLQALDELGKNSAIIALAASFIMGLFICLEISPVLVKLISSVGPYDYLLEKTENDFRLYSKEKIEKGNAWTDHRIDDFKNNLK